MCSFAHKSKSSEPYIKLLNLRITYQEKELLEYLVLKASRDLVQELYKTGGNQDSSFEGISCALGRWASSDFKGVWARPTCDFWRVLLSMETNVAHCGGSDTGCRTPGNNHQHELSHHNFGPIQQPAGSRAGRSQDT